MQTPNRPKFALSSDNKGFLILILVKADLINQKK